MEKKFLLNDVKLIKQKINEHPDIKWIEGFGWDHNLWDGQYPNSQIYGHRDLINTKKTCPNFDVKLWCKENIASPIYRWT